MINFTITSKRDAATLRKIARRAHAMDVAYNAEDARTYTDWHMDFVATHANGNPLRLDGLLEADDFNFAHDAFGVCRHLNRDTGALENFFRPRFSQPSKIAA